MDRELRVLKDGYLLGEINFNYESQTSGTANIKVNNVVDLKDGMKTVYPLYNVEINFSHKAFNSIAEIKAFDETFFKQQPDTASQFDGSVKFVYPSVHYRYLISTTAIIGIADIYGDFLENKKDLQFISAIHFKYDHKIPSDSMEINITLLKRLCELVHINVLEADFALVART